VEARKFLDLYEHAGRVVGALGFTRPKLVLQWHRLIGDRVSVDEAIAQLS